MRTKPPVKVEVIRARHDEDEPTRKPKKGEILTAYPDPYNTKFYKIYRNSRNGNRDPRPILILKKDCKILSV